MKKVKRVFVILLALFMLPSLAACSEKGEERTITIGTWFDIYYVSKHTSIYDDPQVADPETAQMMLDNLRAVEKKHNVKIEFVNLTFEGIQESITTSIMAGKPDCDVYIVDTQFGIPAVLSGQATSLESMGLQDTDVFNAQDVVKYLNVGQDESYLFFRSIDNNIPIYPLAFNMDMVNAKGLENPQDLWDRGEWTWDKWREYLVALTDTNNGIYGWSGYWTRLLENLLFSNGTTIASGPQTTVTSPATVQVFNLIYEIYNVERTARPWDDTDWDINNKMYADGKSGFWIGSDWLFSEQGGGELPFEIGVVPWPVGPAGNKDTNYHGGASANWYMIPRGVEDARFVYDVMFDWLNWYDYDRERAEDLEWSENWYMTERNFEYAFMMSKHTGFDIWNNLSLGDQFSMVEIMSGEKNASQYAAEVEPVIQNALDNFFK
ncbi:MAG: ABC transporter substrate-binding protein [Oscillospiraceae bacterium]|nr:ABC transporter substrate-binding protein [Oscillospiraceae bacterium]